MKILVCEQVPDTSSDGTLNRASMQTIINPMIYERALKLSWAAVTRRHHGPPELKKQNPSSSRPRPLPTSPAALFSSSAAMATPVSIPLSA